MGRRATYFTPNDDAQTALIAVIQSARHNIRVAVFTLTLETLVQALIERKNAGVDVELVLDKSQAENDLYEAVKVTELKTAGIPLIVGTSSKHKIMHDKFIVVDNMTVASGSFNFTKEAQLENNVLDVERNRARATAFTKTWQSIHDYMVQASQIGIDTYDQA